MRTPISAAIFGAAALLVLGASVADAEPTRCKAAIARNAASFVQSRASALANCERDIVVGKLPAATDCHSEPKAATAARKPASVWMVRYSGPSSRSASR